MEQSVLERYAQGAHQVEAALCCPVSYDANLLKILPQEIIDKDYGCGDPSRYVRPGDTVLDLGSGGGKICYIVAQLVGEHGRVIGVDMNDDMLALARKYQQEMAQRLGGDRVAFRKGKIQDLALDLDQVAAYLAEHPLQDLVGLETFGRWQEQLRVHKPMIADHSVDLVISNCVLNLVEEGAREQMFREIYRVLKPGGRVAIADIVSNVVVPDALKKDPYLWSGCISGAFQELAFRQAFAQVGFVGLHLEKWDVAPWQVVEGIEFRSVTWTAIKPPLSHQTDVGHAVIYRGPFAVVEDEQGRRFRSGERVFVSEQIYRCFSSEGYADDFILLPPAHFLPGESVKTCAPGGGCC
ncbi:MAG: methyltransferase domain-containing protein [Magnetococcus sp. DMHC-6]